MSRFTLLLALVCALLLGTAMPAAAQERECPDFESQTEAQDFFERADPGDPHGLDPDADGRACAQMIRAEVVRVNDGDTIVVRALEPRDQATYTVRLIGIDAPEREPAECGGRLATYEARKLAPKGRRVVVESDPARPSVGGKERLAAYVRLDGGRQLNRAQVTAGWARVYAHDTGFQQSSSFKRAARAARNENLGAWGICGGMHSTETFKPTVISALEINGNAELPQVEARITLSLRARAGDRGPSIGRLVRQCDRGGLIWREPGDSRLVRLLLEQPEGSRGYRCGRTELLRGLGLSDDHDLGGEETLSEGMSAQGDDGATLDVRGSEGTAKVVVEAAGVVVGWGVAYIGAWTIDSRDGEIEVQALATDVPRGSARILVLRVRGMRVVQARPLPTKHQTLRTDDQDRMLSWTVRTAHRMRRDVSVVVKPRWETNDRRSALALRHPTAVEASPAVLGLYLQTRFEQAVEFRERLRLFESSKPGGIVR